MKHDVLALWPDAPVASASPDDRWVRFSPADGRIVYLQRYAWDERSRPDFLVVLHDGGDEPAQQRRFGSLPEAVEAVRTAIARAVHA